ncbi:MAG: hypothetical protein NT120_00445 [Candidatus Aenigmarchaeota archaeon]|nr:hypothetical protein [Candidatus Aenigmarchaeota archaeon]
MQTLITIAAVITIAVFMFGDNFKGLSRILLVLVGMIFAFVLMDTFVPEKIFFGETWNYLEIILLSYLVWGGVFSYGLWTLFDILCYRREKDEENRIATAAINYEKLKERTL